MSKYAPLVAFFLLSAFGVRVLPAQDFEANTAGSRYTSSRQVKFARLQQTAVVPPTPSEVRPSENSSQAGQSTRALNSDEESSPSDTRPVPDAEILGTEPGEPEPIASPGTERIIPKQDSLTPQQSRELSPVVTAVNIDMDGIGTGKLPETAPKYRDRSPVWLPDGVSRGATYKCAHWRPSAVFHHPLYFEDAMLERHGHDRWGYFQPVASGAKFLGTLAFAPYLKTLQPHCQCRYALGHHRPGTCAPLLKDTLPWDKRAAAVETALWGGFFWAMPL